MKQTLISVPQLALIAGTRGILGAGIALLVASKLTEDQRRAVGATLLAVGALSTIPLALEIFGKHRPRVDAPDPAMVYGT